MKVPANVRRRPDLNTFKNNCFKLLKNRASVRLLVLLLLLLLNTGSNHLKFARNY